MPKNAGKYAVLLLFVALSLEGLAYLACTLLARVGLVYRADPVTNYAAYLRERDPMLGWPGPASRGQGEVDRSGSRLVPAFPDPATPSCGALFGDSYTWGDEVPPEHSYANVLSQALGCRVANFGVGGYGTDQALLRYEQLRPAAGAVVLGHFSDNIIRNVSQDRGFLTNQPLGLKPRFVVRDGALVLVPLPTLTEAEYARVGSEASTLLPFDYFQPDGPSGLTARRFPFLLSAARALGHYRLRAALRREPSHMQFYEPDHPSGALAVTFEIMKRFVETARSRGQAPLLVLIPGVKDLEWLRAHGVVPYQPLLDRLTAAKLPFVSAAASLDKYLAGKAPCSLYFRCSGSHFRPEGYRELARIVEQGLRDFGAIPVAAGASPH